MKLAVRLTLLISVSFGICVWVSGCCVVEVKHGFSDGSLKLASTKNPFVLPRGKSLRIVVARKSGSCPTHLQIERRQGDVSESISVDGKASTFEYTFEAKGISDSFQYRIRKAAQGGGPFYVVVEDEPNGPTAQYLKGRELGLKHEKRQLRTYRLLIELFEEYPTTSKTYELDRDEFLKGFRAAYAEAKADIGLAKEIEDLLRQSFSLENSIYREVMQKGGLYEKNQISYSEMAKVIHRHRNTPEHELTCKAGFIEGYVQAHSNPDKKSLYEDALWEYITFRTSARF